MTSPEKEPPKPRKPKRSWKVQSLADSLAPLTREICAKQGFAQSEVITRWRDIVGPTLAAHTLPERLNFPKGQTGATLHILADSGFATELQYLAPQAIDRINGYFGYPAVARLMVKQAPVSLYQRKKTRPNAPDPQDQKAAAEDVAAIEDKGLRAVLTNLGAAVLADSRRKKR
ncbi:DUF721 domain-containing protein [Govanella unica]|uniref:DciA family protein n=1 Tax=Govanella unica TaxID=2975056 RepID=A0A9X3TXA8_9PROT|nr:DciA family protein [Govania unica]